MNIAEFVDRHAAPAFGPPLESAGPQSRALHEILGSERRTRALLATNFWQSLLASRARSRIESRLGLAPGAVAEGRTVIVPRAGPGHDLLVFSPALAREEVRVIAAEIGDDDIVEGWHAWMRQWPATAALQRLLSPGMAVEAAHADLRFNVVVTRTPDTELLSVPQPPLGVTTPSGACSTAGAVVRDTGSARHGVTAALHGVQGATTVQVGNLTGTVVRSDVVTDSAFIELPGRPPVGSHVPNGVLSGVLPRGNQTAMFDGLTSPAATTTILAWDRDVPNVAPHRQLRLYTPRDAQPGDSGAALVTDDGYLAGFAFERTRPGEQPEHCSWIWADSVLAALGVSL